MLLHSHKITCYFSDCSFDAEVVQCGSTKDTGFYPKMSFIFLKYCTAAWWDKNTWFEDDLVLSTWSIFSSKLDKPQWFGLIKFTLFWIFPLCIIDPLTCKYAGSGSHQVLFQFNWQFVISISFLDLNRMKTTGFIIELSGMMNSVTHNGKLTG